MIKFYLLCASVVITTVLTNAAEHAPTQEPNTGNRHLIETKIEEYEGLLKGVEHSHSIAKDSKANYHKKYLEDLRALQKQVDKAKEHINIPQELHSIFLHNNPEAAAFSY